MVLHSVETLEKIENKLGYHFSNKDLLSKAFVHRSFYNENKERLCEHNERLEFLGDAVLGLIVSKYLYAMLPESEEGILSHLKARLVDATTCCHYAETLSLGEYVLLGKGEKRNDGKGRESIYADLFEAVIGAIFLDAGFLEAEKVFLRHCEALVLQAISEPMSNYKAKLQEVLQKNHKKSPVYKVLKESGPDHAKQFLVAVFLDDVLLGEGEGLSKKQAEQQAAKNALNRMEET